MFEALTQGFRAARNAFAGQTELTDGNIDEALREVRNSLLEGDVEFRVAKTFIDRVKQKALGQTVKTRARVNSQRATLGPGEHFVRICQQELVALMGSTGSGDDALEWAKKGPTGIMVVGLQGSGKTTTVGKLARYLHKSHHKRPLLVAADVYRPAAVEQLSILGEQIDVPVFSEASTDAVGICERAMRYAFEKGRDVVLFDTAGRLTIDEPLMKELDDIKQGVKPHNILLVCDAMIGQDAVQTAKSFNDRLELTGVILTKLDGDARGGAALSIKEVTGKSIKFVGMGESLDRLEEFRPEGMASRILGMGDIVGLIKDFEEVVEEEQAADDALRMLRGKFDMHDFLEQLKVLKKMSGGGLGEMIDKMGLFPNGLPQGMNVDDRELTKMEAIIFSMTKSERSNPDVFFAQGDFAGRRRREEFEVARVRRVARGSGRKEAEVREILVKFRTMKQMMMTLGAQTGVLGKIPGFRQIDQMRQMKQLMGVDVQKFMEVAGLRAPAMERRSFRPPERNVERLREKRKRQDARRARKRNRK